MLEAVKTGLGVGAVTGRSSRRRMWRLPAAWCRCGIGLTRNLLGVGPWDLCALIQCAADTGRFRVFPVLPFLSAGPQGFHGPTALFGPCSHLRRPEDGNLPRAELFCPPECRALLGRVVTVSTRAGPL